MRGGKNKQPLGYTIVEVMIVLAVSGVMFLIAASFINGKQERTAFEQGSNELVAQLQTIVNDVADGNYSDVPVNCSDTSTPVNFPPGTSPGQGANQGCVFFGKLVHFYRSGTTLPENYEVFSLAAKRTDSGSALNDVAAIPNLTTEVTIPQSLDVATVTADGVHTSNLGFAQDLSTASGGNYEAGAPTISIVYDRNGAVSTVGRVATTNIHASDLRVAQSADICVTDGTRRAKILVGGTENDGNQFNIGIEQQGLGSICT